MTGVLSTIEPGTYTQLSVGLLGTIFYACVLNNFKPYAEKRDTWLAILASCQLILFYLTASFMKFRATASDPFDSEGMGVVIIISFVILLILFLLWAIQQKDDMHHSSNTTAIKALKEQVIHEKGGVIEQTRSNSHFEIENPMCSPKSGVRVAREVPQETPLINPAPRPSESRTLPPVAPPQPELTTNEGTKEGSWLWTKIWDDTNQSFYYEHDDGRIEWEVPEGEEFLEIGTMRDGKGGIDDSDWKENV